MLWLFGWLSVLNAVCSLLPLRRGGSPYDGWLLPDLKRSQCGPQDWAHLLRFSWLPAQGVPLKDMPAGIFEAPGPASPVSALGHCRLLNRANWLHVQGRDDEADRAFRAVDVRQLARRSMSTNSSSVDRVDEERKLDALEVWIARGDGRAGPGATAGPACRSGSRALT